MKGMSAFSGPRMSLLSIGLAIAAGASASVLSPATRAVMTRHPSDYDTSGRSINRYGANGAAKMKRAAAKRRNVLRNRRAHRG